MQNTFKEVTSTDFARLICRTDLVAGQCVSKTEQGGFKASYHDRAGDQWIAFSHILPSGEAHYFAAESVLKRLDMRENWQNQSSALRFA